MSSSFKAEHSNQEETVNPEADQTDQTLFWNQDNRNEVLMSALKTLLYVIRLYREQTIIENSGVRQSYSTENTLLLPELLT